MARKTLRSVELLTRGTFLEPILESADGQTASDILCCAAEAIARANLVRRKFRSRSSRRLRYNTFVNATYWVEVFNYAAGRDLQTFSKTEFCDDCHMISLPDALVWKHRTRNLRILLWHISNHFSIKAWRKWRNICWGTEPIDFLTMWD